MKPHSRAILWLLCATTISAAALAASAGEPGNLMKVSSSIHMQMAGTPAMAPMQHTQTVCSAIKRPDPRDMMRNGSECRVSSYKLIGNTVNYHVECSGEARMSGSGSFTMSTAAFHGVMHMTGGAGGTPMQMDMTVDGTRVGSCDYTPRPAH